MKDLWPFGVALRGEASNRLMLRWLKTVVVSDEEKAHWRRQVGTRKASESEPLSRCRKQSRWHQNRGAWGSRDEPGGCPCTGQAVSGMEAARAWSAAFTRNVGRRPLIPLPVPVGAGGREGARRAAGTARR